MKTFILATLTMFIATFVISQQVFTEDVIISKSTTPKITLDNTSLPNSPVEFVNNNAQRGSISKTNPGNATLDMDPIPTDNTGDALFRFFRRTNTTGVVAFDVLRGNDTAQPNGRISGNGNSFLNQYVGNVGIGTGNPQSKLSVKGGIESQEIQVKASVADYVFSSDYSLTPIDKLEEYIKTHGHLPKIQTQKDVDNNRGFVKLGELSISLMEKVEEMTLHLIDFNKRIVQLENENHALKKLLKIDN